MNCRRAFALVAALYAPSAALAVSPTPDPVKLVLAAIAPSATYQGRLLITRWSGPNARVEEVNVFIASPHRYRLEILDKKGEVAKVLVGNGPGDIRMTEADATFPSSSAPLVASALSPAEEEN